MGTALGPLFLLLIFDQNVIYWLVFRESVRRRDYERQRFLEIQRVHKDYSCGILFAQMEKGEQDTLARTIFNLQAGDRKEHSRANGHW